MAGIEYGRLMKDMPVERFVGMVALETMVSSFYKLSGKDNGAAEIFYHEIKGFIWGLYAADAISTQRRDALIAEFMEVAYGVHKAGTQDGGEEHVEGKEMFDAGGTDTGHGILPDSTGCSAGTGGCQTAVC